MSFLDIAKKRYATKKYDPEKKITEDKIRELKEILRLSPSSIDSQPWKFFFVSEGKTKRALAAASLFNEPKINEASHLVVFSAIDDIRLFEEQIRENLPEGAIDYYNNFVKPLGIVAIKSWLQHQVYLSLGFFLAAAASLDIDSTPMEGIESKKYDEILQSEGYTALFSVALGYRSAEDRNQPSVNPKSRLPLEKIIQSI